MDEWQFFNVEDFEYVGFWFWVGVVLIDMLLVGFVLVLLVFWLSLFDSVLFYGGDWGSFELLMILYIGGLCEFLLFYVLLVVIVIVFWLFKQVMLGKMVIGVCVVDVCIGVRLSIGQVIGCYLGYFVLIFFLLLGLIWVVFDLCKQGWYDKLVGMVVICVKWCGWEFVCFEW